MKRPDVQLRLMTSAKKKRLAAVVSQSERSLLLGTVLVVSSISAVTILVLTQYFSIDALSSLVFVPDDCSLDWGVNVGRHCFSDYPMVVSFGLRPNPWEPYPVNTQSGLKMAFSNYPAAGMVPQMLFGVIGKWLGAPKLGLLGYQFALTLACLSPAIWASRGARGLERVVVFVALGVAAIPAWMAIDRGNSVGFVVPVALVFLVALCRERWGLVALMVVLAAFVKPQFVFLAVVLFAARQWRWGAITVAGAGLTNIAAYALWPRDFPHTIMQSIHNTFGYSTFQGLVVSFNVAFGKGLLIIPDSLKAAANGGAVPDGYLAGPRSLVGYVILLIVIVAVLILGRRIPPVMVGIVLLATAALSPSVSLAYYLVFVLPVAALVVRDPHGPPESGIFNRPATVGGRRRAVGVCVSVAAALCIAQIALPAPPFHADVAAQLQVGAPKIDRAIVPTTVFLTPLLWLIACAAILVSYARRPKSLSLNDDALAHGDASNESAAEVESERSSQQSV